MPSGSPSRPVVTAYEPWRVRFSERYPSAFVTDSLDEVLARPEIGLVSIATRSADHYAHARRALEAGKPVFLEKPMCSTYEQAVALRDASRRGPGTLYVRHNRRFEPGILGQVVQIQLARTSFGRRNDWQTVLEFGGGQLSNWGSHIIDTRYSSRGRPRSAIGLSDPASAGRRSFRGWTRCGLCLPANRARSGTTSTPLFAKGCRFR